MLEKAGAKGAAPSDWCYVFNFERPTQPRALQLPAGRGADLQAHMDAFVEDLQMGLRAAFESEEYQMRRQAIFTEFQEEHEGKLTELQEKARAKGIALLSTPSGFAFAPIRDGSVLSPEEFKALPEEERKQIQADIEALQEEIFRLLRQVPARQRELDNKLRELNRELARHVAHDLLHDLQEAYADLPPVQEYLSAVEADIVENVDELGQVVEEQREEVFSSIIQGERQKELLRRYAVNIIVNRSGGEGAPVVFEEHPTLQNLVGRIEYRSQMGVLATDFTLIRSGALHQANGGYLMLDARKVLTEPFAWDALKRTLRTGEVQIQSLGEEIGIVRTVSLEPEPIPLDVKVVLLGERWLYYLLVERDPEFGELFRVEADLDDQMNRSTESEQQYARLIGGMARQEAIRPLDRYAVARVIEHSARTAGDAEKLSTELDTVRALLHEADYRAARNGHSTVTRDDVEEALKALRRRRRRIRDRVYEEILRGTLLIDTDGMTSGQINGLSVLQVGRDVFGRPSRITARVQLGTGTVIDIEREVELGGPLHSKGVLILAAFLGGRYASDEPLSLSASLVFEQSYGGVEGDSASLAELSVLLSAIGEFPLSQALAVTGSVNQHGRVQAIGGVNEKIEGFFEICKERGLTGRQGVIIPQANVKHLMLDQDVVAAVRNGQFEVYPVETVDQTMELLTGERMGERQEDGTYPAKSMNARVEERLRQLAEERAEYLVLTTNRQNEA